MKKFTPHVSQTPNNWRQLFGPGYQFPMSPVRVSRVCPPQRRQSTSA
jgi:hypothetical protein